LKVLVTGAAGMIGTALIKNLLDNSIDVIGVDNFFRGKLSNIDLLKSHASVSGSKFEFYEYDLSKYIDVTLFPIPDAVVHLADVVAGIKYVFNNEFELLNQNLLIDANVTSFVNKKHIPRYIYVGTACSFPKHIQNGSNSKLFEEEKFPAAPESTYGWSKLMGEILTQQLAKKNITETCSIILHNVYGFYCDFDPTRSQVIPSLIKKASNLKKGEILEVWGSGEQSRSFIDTRDVADFLTAAVLSSKPINIYDKAQIGDPKATSIRKISEIIIKSFDEKKLILRFNKNEPSGDLGRIPDLRKAKSLGFEQKIKIEDGIKDLIDWAVAAKEI